MQFVTKFHLWVVELKTERARLDLGTKRRLGTDSGHRIAREIREMLDFFNFDVKTRPVEEMITTLEVCIRDQTHRRVLDLFRSLFNQYWMALTQQGFEYFNACAKQDSSSIQHFQSAFKNKLTLSKLFNCEVWQRYAQSRVDRNHRFFALDLIRTDSITARTSSSRSSPSVLSEEDRMIMALPHHYDFELLDMERIMKENCSLAEVDRVKLVEVARIEQNIIPKALHAQSRIQREADRIVQVKPLAWPQEEEVTFCQQVTVFLEELIELCQTASYDRMQSRLNHEVTTRAIRARYREEEKKEEDEEDDDAVQPELVQLKRAFEGRWCNETRRAQMQHFAEYCYANILDVQAIKLDTHQFGNEARILEEELKRTEEMCTDQADQAHQIEGSATADSRKKAEYDRVYTAEVQRVNAMDLRLLQNVILNEATAKLKTCQPSIFRAAFSSTQKLNEWRTQLVTIFQFHKLALDRDIKSHRIHYTQFRDRLDTVNQSMFTDHITPLQQLFQKSMRLHRNNFIVIEEQLRSRVRAIRQGVAAYHKFKPGVCLGQISGKWSTQLFGSTTPTLPLASFQGVVYTHHLSTLSSSSNTE
jgi:hypothetical protein